MSDLNGRCRTWQLKTRELNFDHGPAVMGIVNVTPDSFSDGGRYFTPDTAVQQALRLEDGGADILDVGGESTRPYATPVSVEDELRRIEPVLDALAKRVDVPISIDTSKATVAKVAIELGCEIVNDVTGLEGDEAMPELVANAKVGVCAMHMQGNPQTMQDAPHYDDVLSEIHGYLASRDAALLQIGISPNRICLDPGIGFGKTHQHNLELLESAHRFLSLNRPILVGHSRKGFIKKLVGDQLASRDHATTGASLALAAQGIQVLRVHHVAQTKEALIGFIAGGGLSHLQDGNEDLD